MPKCPLVLIEWEDSVRPDAEWQHRDSYRVQGVLTVFSVGWLIKDGRKVKALAPNVGDNADKTNGQCSGVIVIPARAVIKITRLKGPPGA